MLRRTLAIRTLKRSWVYEISLCYGAIIMTTIVIQARTVGKASLAAIQAGAFVSFGGIEQAMKRGIQIDGCVHFFLCEQKATVNIFTFFAFIQAVCDIIQFVNYLPSFMITHISFQGGFPPETMAYCGITMYLGQKSKDILDKLFL